MNDGKLKLIFLFLNLFLIFPNHLAYPAACDPAYPVLSLLSYPIHLVLEGE
jgi:hypothetical protein